MLVTVSGQAFVQVSILSLSENKKFAHLEIPGIGILKNVGEPVSGFRVSPEFFPIFGLMRNQRSVIEGTTDH